jgi:predicted ATPase
VVGREIELAQLHKWFAKALNGERQLVFVTGEPGIGKTTLIEAFLYRLESSVQGHKESQKSKSKSQKAKLGDSSLTPSPQLLAPVFIGRGQCIEQYGASEAYLPILEAMGRLARQVEGYRLVAVLQQYAPTWLVQMPALLSSEEFDTLQRRVLGSTRERMLREMAEALEVLTAEQPMVLVLEDLHWSDYSTLDLVSFVAQRQERARLMIVATYRPVEVFSREHPLKGVKQELQVRGQCVELPLTCLSEAAVAEYLEKRFVGVVDGQLSFPELAHVVYRRTDGHPLFMVNVADYVAAQDFSAVNASVEQSIPESVRQMIEKQIDRLSTEDQRLLEVASVAGAEFSAASVAAGLATGDIDAIEQSCGALARRAQFLQLRGKSVWPDGTIAARYGFIHALYQNVLYYRVTPGRRARLHQRIGQREESGYGKQAVEVATELAVHFEEGQDYQRALHYLRLAGEKAVRRCANREAIDLFTKGLALLKLTPESSQRMQHELLLYIALGVPLVHSRGYAAAEVRQVYDRARELYYQVGETSQLFSVLWGLWLYYVVRGDHPISYEIGQQLCGLERSENAIFPWAHYASGCSLFWLGEIAQARESLERGLIRYDRHQHSSLLSLYTQDPRVVSLLYRSWTLWFLGYPDQALQCSTEAIEWAQELVHPFSLVFALDYTAEVTRLRREVRMTQQRAEAAIAICVEQGFPFWAAWGTVMRGWALAEQGKHEEGITAMREGLAAYEATGAGMGKTLFLSLRADAYRKAGQPEAGLQSLSEAFAFLNKANEHAYEAELWRLKGELTLQGANQKAKGKRQKSKIETNPQSLTPNPQEEVEQEVEGYFLKAIDVARKQSAKSWELRAMMSLVRLRQQQAARHAKRTTHHGSRNTLDEACKMLFEIYNWFTEGLDTKDLQEAKALLEH